MRATTEPGLDHEPIEDVTPVRLSAASLESTAPEYLLECKRDLADAGLAPATLEVTACFDDDCSLATQEEVERLRQHVRAASFLGAGRLAVRVEEVADERTVTPALEACAERAEREGVRLEVEGSVSIQG